MTSQNVSFQKGTSHHDSIFTPWNRAKLENKSLFYANNGTNDTSKHAKFKVDGWFTFRDMTSQNVSFQKGTSHHDSIFTPWNRAKLEKNHFLCLKTSHLFWHKINPPPPPPSAFPSFSSKTKKFTCSLF